MLRSFFGALAVLLCVTAWSGQVMAASPTTECRDDLDALVRHVFDLFGSAEASGLCGDTASIFIFEGAKTANRVDFDLDALPDVGGQVFFGLAAFYNKLQIYSFEGGEPVPLSDADGQSFEGARWLAFAGRYDVFLLRAPGATVFIDEGRLSLEWPAGKSRVVEAILADKGNLSAIGLQGGDLRYGHLWNWLAALASAIEWLLLAINQNLSANWGLSIFALAVILKAALLPAGIVTVHYQRQVSKHQAALAPRLAAIKAEHTGQEAHERVMAAHKALGISPFYTLKPMIGTAIQIPVLIAVFAALGEMPQLSGAPFLWIDDLSMPDSVAAWSFSIPGMGDGLNLLPFAMTAVTVFATIMFHDPHAPRNELRRQKRNLFLMAAAFFILFYPFPAAVVLFWMAANFLQIIQQRVVKL